MRRAGECDGGLSAGPDRASKWVDAGDRLPGEHLSIRCAIAVATREAVQCPRLLIAAANMSGQGVHIPGILEALQGGEGDERPGDQRQAPAKAHQMSPCCATERLTAGWTGAAFHVVEPNRSRRHSGPPSTLRR